MFNSNGNRYITTRVAEQIHPIIIMLLWELIEDIPEQQRDYLQILKLSVDATDSRHQLVEHTQEKPYYKNNKMFYTLNPVNAKLYFIDDGTVQMMMFVDEY